MRMARLAELSARCGCPGLAFDEAVKVAPEALALGLDRLRAEGWAALRVEAGRATVVAADPLEPGLAGRIQAALGVTDIDFKVALIEDVERILTHNCDVNPGFPASAGRTILARVRTYLAIRRSQFATYRTRLAKGRTGLAFLRTGLSFGTMVLVLIRVFGFGYLAIVEAALALAGLFLVVDGLIWYLPARDIAKRQIAVPPPPAEPGVSVLEVTDTGPRPAFRHSPPVPGAEALRDNWDGLSPVMRRRVLALERTDLAEQRTRLAAYRSVMAKARTGLALTRTGIALVGVGIALLRHPGLPIWIYPDAALILIGLAMIAEGFHWYFPGRNVGKGGLGAVAEPETTLTAWDLVLPPPMGRPNLPDWLASCEARRGPPPAGPGDEPGILGTTGLALERTVLAERRNLMARYRTVMTRSRTGMSLIRTGMNFCAVGLGLLVAYGLSSPGWSALEFVILAVGLALVVDGHSWYLPAEKWRAQFSFCDGQFEIPMPDYGVPHGEWEKVVFEHDHA